MKVPAPAPDNGFSDAVQSLTESVRNTCADPADAIRLLIPLTSSPGDPATLTADIATMQTSMGLLFRVSALVSLANACATYQPRSWDEGMAARFQIDTVFGAVILAVADAGMDTTYQALRKLRSAVIADITARSVDLSRIMTVDLGNPQPALSVAYRLYQDATRSDELINEADPRNPNFLPPRFTALSS